MVADNEITDVIDMTKSGKKETEQESELNEQQMQQISSESLPKEVRLFSPIFTTPLGLREHKLSRKLDRSPIMPGIVYPFPLEKYQFPCDIGSYIFWQSYKAATTELDCKVMGFHSGQDLLELTSAIQAADFLTDLVAPKSDDQIVKEKASSTTENDDGSSSSEENDEKLQSITISVLQLCQKLKKINHRFSYELVNENEEWSEEHATDELSTAKKQRIFCENTMSQIMDWQQ